MKKKCCVINLFAKNREIKKKEKKNYNNKFQKYAAV